jgi:hypothetical protein
MHFSDPGYNMHGMRVSGVHKRDALVPVRRLYDLHNYAYMERRVLPVSSGST